MKTGDELYYNVKFYVDFSDFPGSHFWMPSHNIAGLYTGDIETQKALALMQKDQDMEEHEIDDDYHLKQLYKKDTKEPKEIKIGDDVVLTDSNYALYQSGQEEFVSVWFKPGHVLGKVQDIAVIKGYTCAKTSKAGAWYKISCLKND